MSTTPTPSPLGLRWRGLPGAAVAVIDASGIHTLAAVRDEAAALARGLQARLPTPGERVLMMIEPGATWVTTFFGIALAGHVAVPLCPAHPDAELARLARDADPAVYLAAGVHGGRAIDGATTPEEPGSLAEEGPAPPLPDAEAIALMLYTSGTTGQPKGVQISHRALAQQADRLARTWGLDATTRLLHVLPLHHMHGVAIALLPTLLAGGAARMLGRFRADAVWSALGDDGPKAVNTMMMVPTMVHRLVAAHAAAAPQEQRRMGACASALNLATSGSAALPATLADAWRAIAGAMPLERYGMTEIGVACSNPLDAASRRLGHVGAPLMELRIVGEDGAVGDGPGEIQVRGPALFSGYWRRPEATADAHDGPWFKTGDWAERHPSGDVRILGRSSVDILKSGGYKLSAIEIEELLRQHPAVEEVAVVGLPDEAWGQRVVAAIVAREAIDTDTLRAWAKTRMAAYKVPRQVVVLDALPRNAVGKVVKPRLAELLSNA